MLLITYIDEHSIKVIGDLIMSPDGDTFYTEDERGMEIEITISQIDRIELRQ